MKQNKKPVVDVAIVPDEVPKRTVVAIPCFNEEKTIGSVSLW